MQSVSSSSPGDALERRKREEAQSRVQDTREREGGKVGNRSSQQQSPNSTIKGGRTEHRMQFTRRMKTGKEKSHERRKMEKPNRNRKDHCLNQHEGYITCKETIPKVKEVTSDGQQKHTHKSPVGTEIRSAAW